MALSEIEKLERRYAENPQGLTFAPLAEVHRNNGEVQRALDLLGPGLEVHPDYIPASIVLGRCHLDLGDVHAAERAFLHVLALDGENVIALKALADISERLLKFEDAERWLTTLLAVDRSNDDALEQLQRVEGSRRQAEVGSSAEPSSVIGAQAALEEPQAASEASPPLSPSPSPFEPPVAEPARGWVSQSVSQMSEPSPIDPAAYGEPSALQDEFEEPAKLQFEQPADIQIDEPLRFEDSVEPIQGLVGREVDTPDEHRDFELESNDDIVLRSSGGSEFQMPDASQELFSGPRGDRPSYAQRGPFEEDAPLPASAAADVPPLPERESAVAEPGEVSGLTPVELEPLPEARTSEAWTPEAGTPETGMSEAGTPDTVAPEAAAPEAAAPEAAAPEAAASEAVAPEAAASEAVAPEAAASEAVAPEAGAPEAVAPEAGASEAVAPEAGAPEAIAPEPEPQSLAAEPTWVEPPAPYPAAAVASEPEPVAPAAPFEPVPTTAGAEVRMEPRERDDYGFQGGTEELEDERAAPSPSRRPYSVVETGGRSVVQLLQGILSARPPVQRSAAPVRQAPAADSTGAPTRPAADALSLSSVFGEEAPETPPAVPTSNSGPGSVSFDDFFSSQGGSPRTQRAPDPKNDDLDQFHAWLQNLKR